MSGKRQWHRLLLWMWGGGVGEKQISNPPLSFHQPPTPIYLYISTMILFSFFSTFNHFLIFSAEFKQKWLLCPLILLLTINLIVTYNCKTLLSTIFEEISGRASKGRMNWPEIKPGRKKKKPPLIYKAQASNWGRRKTLLGQNCLSQPKNARRRKTWGLLSAKQQPPPPGGLLKPESIWPELQSHWRRKASCSPYWAHWSPIFS